MLMMLVFFRDEDVAVVVCVGVGGYAVVVVLRRRCSRWRIMLTSCNDAVYDDVCFMVRVLFTLAMWAWMSICMLCVWVMEMVAAMMTML